LFSFTDYCWRSAEEVRKKGGGKKRKESSASSGEREGSEGKNAFPAHLPISRNVWRGGGEKKKKKRKKIGPSKAFQ